jgi:CHAT domain-containing protein/tetratricopeptide (TPR) repeat protein
MWTRLLGAGGALLVVLGLAACREPAPRTTDPVPADTTILPAGIPDSLRSDSLAAALARFGAASTPSPTDSAAVRRWTDSLEERGSALRDEAPAQARGYLRQARHAQRQIGDSTDLAEVIEDIGFTYRYQSRYRDAMRRYRGALALHRTLGNREYAANALTHIGIIRDDQGQYEKAFLRFREAYRTNRALGDSLAAARSLNSIGIIRWRQNQYERAIDRFQSSIDIYQSMGDREATASLLNNIGVIRRDQGTLEAARARFRDALRIKRAIGDREGIARTRNNLGSISRRLDRPEQALDQYRAALQIERSIGDRKSISENLNDIGTAHLRAGHLQAATDTLRRAVGLVERLRLSATSPEARRALLSSQVGAYRALTTAHVRAGRPDSALRALERIRARLLADHLAGTATGDTTFTIPPSAGLRRGLGPQEAALLYANAGPEWPLTALVVTQDTVHATLLPDSTVRATIGRTFAGPLRRLRRQNAPLAAAVAAGPPADSTGGPPSLTSVIRLYRHHLTQDGVPSEQRALARRLHDLLIAPVAAALRPATTVTVVPAGPLGYLPFETLRTPGGRYLVETARVRYAQSLTVLRQLQQRDYAASRRPLLALGGADYTAPSPDDRDLLLAGARGDSIDGEPARGASLLQAVERQRNHGRSPRPTYARLGYDRWPTLHGTKLEVQKLARVLGGRTLTGAAAAEPRLRQMSRSGTLARYRRVHFATHGLTVPTAPALSALVLSQAGGSERLAARDGYLTMPEIADLRLRADVAVLSACRTGLGGLVDGEGVVNLSHAFLRAGANATLVSQWRVLDWSTQQFMTAAYRTATADTTSFAEAVTKTKRAFIAGRFGERNRDPLRWAPFVYYGRE